MQGNFYGDTNDFVFDVHANSLKYINEKKRKFQMLRDYWRR